MHSRGIGRVTESMPEDKWANVMMTRRRRLLPRRRRLLRLSEERLLDGRGQSGGDRKGQTDQGKTGGDEHVWLRCVCANEASLRGTCDRLAPWMSTLIGIDNRRSRQLSSPGPRGNGCDRVDVEGIIDTHGGYKVASMERTSWMMMMVVASDID